MRCWSSSRRWTPTRGALSLLAGLYQFELTPPHAELLGRLAQVAGAAGAPFIAAIGPDALKTPEHDWHPLIRQAWDALRALPAAAYFGLATPRFLLRMPYGKRTDPIDAFAFEEFTRQGGLSGMLWANPAVAVTQVLAETWMRNKKMELGSVANVGDLPVYVYHDQDGDQIALPCTERLFTEKLAAQVAALGVIPLVSLRGRPELRVASFNGVGGKRLAGRWAPVDVSTPAAAPAPAKAAPASRTHRHQHRRRRRRRSPRPEPAAAAAEADTSELDALLAGLTGPDTAAAAPEPEPAPAAAAEDDLDALLASLNAEPEKPAEADETEADLDALLASLK